MSCLFGPGRRGEWLALVSTGGGAGALTGQCRLGQNILAVEKGAESDQNAKKYSDAQTSLMPKGQTQRKVAQNAL